MNIDEVIVSLEDAVKGAAHRAAGATDENNDSLARAWAEVAKELSLALAAARPR